MRINHLRAGREEIRPAAGRFSRKKIREGQIRTSSFFSFLTLRCQAAGSKPGTKGNLIVNLLAERITPAGVRAPARVARVELGVLPAIPFEIVQP